MVVRSSSHTQAANSVIQMKNCDKKCCDGIRSRSQRGCVWCVGCTHLTEKGEVARCCSAMIAMIAMCATVKKLPTTCASQHQQEAEADELFHIPYSFVKSSANNALLRMHVLSSTCGTGFSARCIRLRPARVRAAARYIGMCLT